MAGEEYYYCKNTECQKLLKAESKNNNFSVSSEIHESSHTKNLPEYLSCPNCKTEMELSEEERKSGKVHCPDCETFIEYNFNPPKIMKNENYVELVSTLNWGDIAIVRSLLENSEIDYFVAGENFLSARPLLEPVVFYVNESQFKEAKEIIKDVKIHIWGNSINQ